jgi:replicative DNA helicase
MTASALSGQLSNVGIERAILAGVFKHGSESFFDIQDILQTNSFTNETNSAIFKCYENIYSADDSADLDIPSLMSSARELGLDHLFTKPEDREHLRSIINTPVNQSNVRKFAAQLRKLQIARLIREQLLERSNEILDFKGTESVNQLLGAAEIDFSSLLNSPDDSPKKVGEGLRSRYEELAENPIDQVGLSTGFPIFDKAIGGGLRGGSVNVVGARMKVGKSVLSTNIAWHVAKTLNIPVLYLDTELRISEQQDRLTAKVSGIPINEIETGKFAEQPFRKEKLFTAVKEIDDVPYYHISVAGSSPEDQLAIIRRWIRKEVGVGPDGKANKCLVILDYLKLMAADNISGALQEYQMLGFYMTSLHNFSMRYDIPIFTLVQLNRDGISKESSDVVGGSDRILQLCTNFSIFKPKSDEEIAEDGRDGGNRKWVILMARHGPGMDDKNYINLNMRGEISDIDELHSKFELNAKRQGSAGGEFRTNNEPDEENSVPFD